LFGKKLNKFLRIIAHLTSLCTKAVKVYKTTTTKVRSEGLQKCPHIKTKEGNKQLERGLFTQEVPNPNDVSPVATTHWLHRIMCSYWPTSWAMG